MRIYNLIFIFKNRSFLKDYILIFENFLIYNNFVILSFQNWGVLPFYYKIKGKSKGVFIFFKIKVDPIFLEIIIKYTKNNINSIIRYLILLSNVKNNSFLNYFILKKRINVIKKKNKKKI